MTTEEGPRLIAAEPTLPILCWLNSVAAGPGGLGFPAILLFSEPVGETELSIRTAADDGSSNPFGETELSTCTLGAANDGVRAEVCGTEIVFLPSAVRGGSSLKPITLDSM
jgi:hypothetical protein